MRGTFRNRPVATGHPCRYDDALPYPMELTLIDSGATTAEQLKQFADRMENLLNEIDGLKSDLKDLKGEAKSAGFNIKALDRLGAFRRKDSADAETELLNDLLLYAHATGTHLDLAMPDDSGVGSSREEAA